MTEIYCTIHVYNYRYFNSGANDVVKLGNRPRATGTDGKDIEGKDTERINKHRLNILKKSVLSRKYLILLSVDMTDNKYYGQ